MFDFTLCTHMIKKEPEKPILNQAATKSLSPVGTATEETTLQTSRKRNGKFSCGYNPSYETGTIQDSRK
ncbi:unnamed protein product [Macrosiphum euphorbiae]|uniref:Uncharacterized protein n=1 Tax=Macrosiphum euphorbiae TaxID=13131 RepID=A0AAV0XXD9_9HEMI|nr:unnamed protein product [Macrosiphum euphorbiae]